MTCSRTQTTRLLDRHTILLLLNVKQKAVNIFFLNLDMNRSGNRIQVVQLLLACVDVTHEWLQCCRQANWSGGALSPRERALVSTKFYGQFKLPFFDCNFQKLCSSRWGNNKAHCRQRGRVVKSFVFMTIIIETFLVRFATLSSSGCYGSLNKTVYDSYHSRRRSNVFGDARF